MRWRTFLNVLVIVVLISSLIYIIYLWESPYILNPKIEFREGNKVIFDDNVIKILNKAYDTEKEEYVYCLSGYIKNNTYYIESVKKANMVNQTNSHVFYERCPEFSLGTLHNHIQGVNKNPKMYLCGASYTDAYYFGDTGESLMIIQCGVNYISIIEHPKYGESFSAKSLKWESLNIS